MKKSTLALASLVILQACASTDPGDAAGIDYRLPRTDAKVTLSIDVTQCVDKNHADQVRADMSLKIDAVAGVQNGFWHVKGESLSSSVTKRGLVIDVDDNGVIASINSASTDQSTVILGAAVKLAANLVSSFGAAPGGTLILRCTQTISAANENLSALKKKLDTEKVALWDPSGKNPAADAQRRVNALASMLANTKESLHRDVVAKVKLDNTGSALKVEFDTEELSELFEVWIFGNGATAKLTPDKQEAEFHKIFFMDAQLTSAAKPDPAVLGDAFSGKQSCEQAIVLPNAQPVTLSITPTGSIFDKNQTNPVSKTFYASQSFPAEQSKKHLELCITARFGEDRTVGLKFDKFGRVIEFNWSSEARAANVASALAGAAPDVASTSNALRDWGLTKKKSELDELTTEQALRKARICKTTLDVGGTSCVD